MKSTNPRPIICGTDLSANSGRAAVVAAALANRWKAPLLLVHASILPALAPTEEQIRARVPLHPHDPAGLTVEVVEGNADEVLVELAEQQQARLLVVSSLGQRSPGRWLLGSVAERVAESSPVPTLVVRDAAPFEAWLSGEHPLKVFVGVDFGASSDAALRWIAELRQMGPVEVAAGYVDWPPDEAARLGLTGPVGTIGNPPMIQKVLERDLREKVTKVLGGDKMSVMVRGN